MKFLKNNFVALICSVLILGVVLNLNKITDKIAKSLEKNPEVVLQPSSPYAKDDDFIYVQETDDFIPLSYQDLMNIFYTITNRHYENFTFYCPGEYTNCVEDAEAISNDPEILTNINNYVHPYNSFSNVQTSIAESGEINVNLNYLYTTEEITKLDKTVNKIYESIITNEMSDYEKIKTIHDYIINHSKYDVQRNTNNDSPYLSYKAYGPLIEGYATCSGYTDAMAIFLEKMGIKNFKVATELMQKDISGHVWNALYLDNHWVHLDLTWDDPVSDDGKDYLQHKYFLISTNELEKADAGQVEVKEHIFNKRVYPEMKNTSM